MSISTATLQEFSILPEEYKTLTQDEAAARVLKVKEREGGNLLLLAHHYQRMEIVDVSDFRGDSLQLAKEAERTKDASHIIFCGVKFMAESAAILAGDHQIVQHPNLNAGCPLVDMAQEEEVEEAWEIIGSEVGQENVMPVAYINCHGTEKAFCGRNGGVICTSTNAERVFKWSYARRAKMLFLPDEHLARNMANRFGIPKDEQVLWDPDKEHGGATKEQLQKAKLIVWKGFCHVHARFTPEDVTAAREKLPDAKIIVHPECREEVTRLADMVGSTNQMVKFVEDAAPGTKIFIGTEISLIQRLARDNPDKVVMDLGRSLCGNMFRINLNYLAWTVENLGKVNVIRVPESIRKEAVLALNRMLFEVG